MTTSWDVHYIGGYHDLFKEVSNRKDDLKSTLWGLNTWRGYHHYIKGYLEYIRDVQDVGGYHDSFIKRISLVHGGVR